MDRLKKWAEIIAVATATWALLSGLVTGIVSVTGGSLPPWVSAAEGQQLRNQQSAVALSVLLLQRNVANDELDAAKADLAANPNSSSARKRVQDLRFQIHAIDRQLTNSGYGTAPND